MAASTIAGNPSYSKGFNMSESFINTGDYKADVFIAGGGPIGATYAKFLVDAGYKVIMAEMGAAASFRHAKTDDGEVWIPGAHKKNEVDYQKDIDRFVHVIKGALSPVSVPVEDLRIEMLNPIVWGADGAEPPVTNGKNPNQKRNENLPGEAVTRCMGGMSTHWTCATPRFNKEIELPVLLRGKTENFNEWKRIYDKAESLIGTTTTAFDESIRHTLVLKTLQAAYAEKSHTFEALPLACNRMANPDYVNWHAADTILESIYVDSNKRKRFTLLTNHRCTKVVLDDSQSRADENSVCVAELKDFLDERGQIYSRKVYVLANVFIIAAGAVATPQILFNSGFVNKDENVSLIKNVGKYMTEQPMTFCQIVLKQSLMDSIPNNPYNLDWWGKKVQYQKKHHPEDPLKFPFRDPEPQVMLKLDERRPWHAQIHRDAFSYGDVAATIDNRTIVDLRFFGYVDPNPANMITFEKDYEDGYGMPQPTFHFNMSKEDRERAHNMMSDMCDVASKLGGYLPGSEPQFMAPGLALHLGGTTRAGLEAETHVADTYCKVYGFRNLYVGGNSVIPTGYAANPTLTSIGYAIRSVESIIKGLGGPKKTHE